MDENKSNAYFIPASVSFSRKSRPSSIDFRTGKETIRKGETLTIEIDCVSFGDTSSMGDEEILNRLHKIMNLNTII